MMASDDHQSFMEEAETSLSSELCGFCGLPKRPERAMLGADLAGRCRCPNAADSTEPGIRVGAVPSSAFRHTPSPRPSVCPPANRAARSVGTAEAGKLEIVSIREKHGQFRKAVPHMPLPVAVVLCLMNVVIPGTGTLISAFTIFCGCRSEYGEKKQSVLYNLCAALLQLLLAPIIVGWIWSVLWGITFVNISVSKAVEEPGSSDML